VLGYGLFSRLAARERFRALWDQRRLTSSGYGVDAPDFRSQHPRRRNLYRVGKHGAGVGKRRDAASTVGTLVVHPSDDSRRKFLSSKAGIDS